MYKKILIGLTVIIVALVGVAFLLPRQVRVERSILIDAPQEQVFDLLNSFERFKEWSPWYERDPDAVVTFDGPSSGVNASMSWKSTNREVGSGTNTIITSEPTNYIRTRLSFDGHTGAESFFNLSHHQDGTEVVWGFESDLGTNPVNRYFGLLMDHWIGKDYEHGLAKLKAVAEGGN